MSGSGGLSGALCFVGSPRRINFKQPVASEDNPRQVFVGEGSSSPVVEMHLDQRHVPRVARVDVQGLRPSLDPTSYQARPAPPPAQKKLRNARGRLLNLTPSHAYIYIYTDVFVFIFKQYGPVWHKRFW